MGREDEGVVGWSRGGRMGDVSKDGGVLKDAGTDFN